jgi:hypothetical protein
LATCARSLAGRDLNCSIISVALKARTIPHQLEARKIDLLPSSTALDNDHPFAYRKPLTMHERARCSSGCARHVEA